MPSLPPPMRLPRSGIKNDAGGANVLILVRAAEVAERAPEVDNHELRLAIVHAGDAGRIAKLDEALAEVAGHRARVHPVARGEIDVVAVDRRTGARHPHAASATSRRDIPDRRRRRETGVAIEAAHVVGDDEPVSRTMRVLAIDGERDHDGLVAAGVGQQPQARAHLLVRRREAVRDPAAAVVGIACDKHRWLLVGERVRVEDPEHVVAFVVLAGCVWLAERRDVNRVRRHIDHRRRRDSPVVVDASSRSIWPGSGRGSNGAASWRVASWAPVLTSKTYAVFVMVNT